MRELNEKQHEKLERLADGGDPTVKVVGWYDGEKGTGPVIRKGTEERVPTPTRQPTRSRE